jgi:hypothetical protein
MNPGISKSYNKNNIYHMDFADRHTAQSGIEVSCTITENRQNTVNSLFPLTGNDEPAR